MSSEFWCEGRYTGEPCTYPLCGCDPDDLYDDQDPDQVSIDEYDDFWEDENYYPYND